VSDWRQIQARIRKARTSSDPPAQLAELYERTHDAMVAFELAQIYEKSGAHSDAARWYTSAAERFRRAQWKQKAEEALTRLGAPLPTSEISHNEDKNAAVGGEPQVIHGFTEPQIQETDASLENEEQKSVFEQPPGSTAAASTAGAVAAPATLTAAGHRRKRRGRRGGRGRNKNVRPATTAAAITAATVSPMEPVESERVATQARAVPATRFDVAENSEVLPETVTNRNAEAAPASILQNRARAGDPALSSRITQLESQLRRLLACQLHSVAQPDEAPAGPGVFLITDSDQTTYYYIESCQTLRVGVGNMLRGGRGRDGVNVKEKLADHLGINEARVSKYLKDHCAVRWLQLDEGAPVLAHFAIAVLRPVATE
jgi:hypothetical protein